MSGKPHTGYTYNQLQIVSKTENRPPESTQKRFIVEALLGRKKIKNKIHFLVKWKNYPTSKNTWESREHLIKDVPKTIKLYESKNK